MDNIETKISNVKLNTEQKSKYEGAEDNFFRSIERNPKLKATGLMELRRLTEELKIDTTVNKIITELKINPQKQIVLFATRVNDSEIYDEESLGSLKEISKILSDKGIEHAKVFASNKKAKEDIDKFQKGEIKVILTTPQSGGTGLSLDDVDGDKPRKAIVMTPPFSAMEFIQMAGRINRLNTKSKAEIELLSTETMTDSWNKDIIANKLLTLGSAVSGDYRKLDIKELDRLQFMGNEDQREYLKNKGMEDQKIPYFEERKININEFKKDRQKEDKSEKSIFPKYPLRNINAYKTFIPKDENLAWPDAEINFGKYKGKTLSQLQDKDSGYLGWLLSNIKSKYKNIVTDITFITEMSKAMNKAYIKIHDNFYIDLSKAKAVPVGTISKDGRTKKAAEGKWVPVGKDKPKKTDDKSPDNKSPELDEKNKGTIKNVLKRVASILAEALSGKDTVSPTGTTIEEAGESATAKKKKIPTGKDTKKE